MKKNRITNKYGIRYAGIRAEVIRMAYVVKEEAAQHNYAISRIGAVLGEIQGKPAIYETCASCLESNAQKIIAFLTDYELWLQLEDTPDVLPVIPRPEAAEYLDVYGNSYYFSGMLRDSYNKIAVDGPYTEVGTNIVYMFKNGKIS
jgi:hypothetical protein